MVLDGGAGGAAPVRETSSSLKSMRCVAGSLDGLLVQGVSKKRRAVVVLCVAGMVNVPRRVAQAPLTAVTLTRFV